MYLLNYLLTHDLHCINNTTTPEIVCKNNTHYIVSACPVKDLNIPQITKVTVTDTFFKYQLSPK